VAESFAGRCATVLEKHQEELMKPAGSRSGPSAALHAGYECHNRANLDRAGPVSLIDRYH